MKHVIFTFSFFLLTMVGFAQSQSTSPNGEERANHNTTRSNKIAPITNNGNNGDAAIFKKRKCIKAGGTFYEWPSGKTYCKAAATTQTKAAIPQGTPIKMSDRKKCWKSGGVWLTTSSGTFCLKTLERKSSL